MWAREKLYQIVNYRYVKRMPTVITSPYALDEMDKRLAARFSDKRFCETVTIAASPYHARAKPVRK
jgi:DNA replication protein DnaC